MDIMSNANEAYWEGVEAYREGYIASENPYKDSNEKDFYDWRAGFLWARKDPVSIQMRKDVIDEMVNSQDEW